MCSRTVSTLGQKFGGLLLLLPCVCEFVPIFSFLLSLSLPISLCIIIGGQRVKVDATAQRPPPLHATMKFTQNVIILFIIYSQLRSVVFGDSVWMALPINELIHVLNCLWFLSYGANEAFLFLIFLFFSVHFLLGIFWLPSSSFSSCYEPVIRQNTIW